jgi:hypothetical protein
MHDCHRMTQHPHRWTDRSRHHGPTVAHAGRIRTPPIVITTRWPPFAPADFAAETPPFAVCAPRNGVA